MKITFSHAELDFLIPKLVAVPSNHILTEMTGGDKLYLLKSLMTGEGISNAFCMEHTLFMENIVKDASEGLAKLHDMQYATLRWLVIQLQKIITEAYNAYTRSRTHDLVAKDFKSELEDQKKIVDQTLQEYLKDVEERNEAALKQKSRHIVALVKRYLNMIFQNLKLSIIAITISILLYTVGVLVGLLLLGGMAITKMLQVGLDIVYSLIWGWKESTSIEGDKVSKFDLQKKIVSKERTKINGFTKAASLAISKSNKEVANNIEQKRKKIDEKLIK